MKTFRNYRLGAKVRPAPVGTPELMRAMKAVQAPPVLLRSHVDYRPQMDGNDEVGDCTAVGVANAIRAQAALSGSQVSIQKQQTLDFYSAVSGWTPSDPKTDTGAYETDVLSYQLKHGFRGDAQAEWVGAWGTVDPKDLNAMRLTMAHLGCAYLGVQLAEADEMNSGVWDTNTPGDQTPGSAGGHCLLAWAYDGIEPDSVVQLVTWGMLQPATWRWVQSRMIETHGLVHRQILKPDGLNFAGLDWDRLRAECGA